MNQKFIVADSEVAASFDIPVIIMLDAVFWADRYDELESWCKQNQGRIQGMTVELDSTESLMAFILKWS